MSKPCREVARARTLADEICDELAIVADDIDRWPTGSVQIDWSVDGLSVQVRRTWKKKRGRQASMAPPPVIARRSERA